MKKLFFLIGMFFLLISQGFYPYPNEASASFQGFVTTDWLRAHANDPGIIIVDVSFNREDYEKEHIPNSVFVDWRRDIADTREEKYYRIVPKKGFEEVMHKIGATYDKTIIFYDNRNNRLAIRALWVAEYYGHENAAILEGGISAWKLAGFETTTEVPTVRPRNYTVKRSHPEMNADKDYVDHNLRNSRIMFVDSRPWKMYTGEMPGRIIHTGEEVARRGHLPGAVNLPWKSNMNEKSVFLDKNVLIRLYGEKGIWKDKLVVFYCNEGIHAAFNWFVATKILGLKDVRIYEGSMGEWADEPLLPMVSGIGF